jgi:hypothetical protein
MFCQNGRERSGNIVFSNAKTHNQGTIYLTTISYEVLNVAFRSKEH